MTADTSPAREDRYRELLLRHLAGRELKEILFFVNARRFHALDRSIGALLRRDDVSVLNVAGGPFALEFYLEGRKATVTSIDLDPALPALHDALRTEGLVPGSSHAECDVLAYEPAEPFDLIIINDLFYSPMVDFGAVFEKYRQYLKPQGVLYFDILDERASLLWRAFNKDARFRRYAMTEVRETLGQAGFVIEREEPWFGVKSGPDRLVRKLMWRVLGIANNIVFTARRKGLALILATFGIAFGAVELEALLG